MAFLKIFLEIIGAKRGEPVLVAFDSGVWG